MDGIRLCTYCGVVCNSDDHVIPRWLLERAGDAELDLSKIFRIKKWIVPACIECNSSLGNRIFPTITERRKAAQKHIRRKYAAILRVPDWSADELAEMGERAREDILSAIRQRTAVRARLAWRGCRDDADIIDVFDIAKQLARKHG